MGTVVDVGYCWETVIYYWLLGGGQGRIGVLATRCWFLDLEKMINRRQCRNFSFLASHQKGKIAFSLAISTSLAQGAVKACREFVAIKTKAELPTLLK